MNESVPGDELLRRLRHWKFDPDDPTRQLGLPAGRVIASPDTTGHARRVIATSVAWNQISPG